MERVRTAGNSVAFVGEKDACNESFNRGPTYALILIAPKFSPPSRLSKDSFTSAVLTQAGATNLLRSSPTLRQQNPLFPKYLIWIDNLVAREGLEPPTPGL
jgi:hypothetical protein